MIKNETRGFKVKQYFEGILLVAFIGLVFTFAIHVLEGNIEAGYLVFGVTFFLGIIGVCLPDKCFKKQWEKS